MQEHHVTGYSMIGILMHSLLGVYLSILPRLVESKQEYAVTISLGRPLLVSVQY